MVVVSLHVVVMSLHVVVVSLHVVAVSLHVVTYRRIAGVTYDQETSSRGHLQQVNRLGAVNCTLAVSSHVVAASPHVVAVSSHVVAVSRFCRCRHRYRTSCAESALPQQQLQL